MAVRDVRRPEDAGNANPNRRKESNRWLVAFLLLVIALAGLIARNEYVSEKLAPEFHAAEPPPAIALSHNFGPPVDHVDPIPAEIPGYLHIMCVGDSITFGYNEARSAQDNYAHPGGGYRAFLRHLLPKNVQFVGDVEAGPGSSAWCEGHGGIDSPELAAWFPIWDEHIPVDAYLLEIGTNDSIKLVPRDVSVASNRRIWTEMLAVNPRATIYVASIPPCRDLKIINLRNSWIARYNSMLRQQVAAFHNPNVRFVDLNRDAGLTASDFGTVLGAHPTPAGYEKMARFWAHVLNEARPAP